MQHRLRQHLRENRILYGMGIVFFLVGLFLGQSQIALLSADAAEALTHWLHTFSAPFTSESAATLFWAALRQQGKSLLTVWFLGMTLIGAPLILGVLLYRGMALGFTLHLLFRFHSFRGLGIFLFAVLPQNLLYIPCLCAGAVLALRLSVQLLKKKRKQPFLSLFLKYQLAFLLLFLLTVAGSLVEAWISPFLFQWLL